VLRERRRVHLVDVGDAVLVRIHLVVLLVCRHDELHLTRDDLDLGVDLLATKLAEGLDGGNGGDIRATEEAERNAEDHVDDRPRGHAHVVIDPAVGPHVPRPDELDTTNHCRDSRLARPMQPAACGLKASA